MIEMMTGFVWNELSAWHDLGSGAGPLRAEGWIEPGEPHAENITPKRRIRSLLDASGLLAQLKQLSSSPATTEQLSRFHGAEYLAAVRELSDGLGGSVGIDAWVGPGSFEAAALAVGGTIAAVDAVLRRDVVNAYALVRPCGHHADRAGGAGFCIFNNLVVAALHARAEWQIDRIAIIDWDAHHGNGTQAAFYADPSVLTVSIHQDGLFPPGSGSAAETGLGAAVGTNINIPLPPGSGAGSYHYAFEQLIEPAVRQFEPDLILVACGFDANGFDPMSRLLLSPQDFRWMTNRMMVLAHELTDGKLVLSQEGGYHAGVLPFCGLAVAEELSGLRTQVVDPFSPLLDASPWRQLQPHQRATIDAIVHATRSR